MFSQNILVALKVGTVTGATPSMLKYIKERVASIQIEGQIKCRVWVRQALILMAEEGLSSMVASENMVDEIMAEADSTAASCYESKTRTVKQSDNYQP